jgi:hypothetical protein
VNLTLKHHIPINIPIQVCIYAQGGIFMNPVSFLCFSMKQGAHMLLVETYTLLQFRQGFQKNFLPNYYHHLLHHFFTSYFSVLSNSKIKSFNDRQTYKQT